MPWARGCRAGKGWRPGCRHHIWSVELARSVGRVKESAKDEAGVRCICRRETGQEMCMTVCHVWKPSEKRSAVGLSGKLSALDPRWLRAANWWYGRNAFGVFGQLLGDALGKGKIEFARQKCIAGEEHLARKRQTRHVEISTGRDLHAGYMVGALDLEMPHNPLVTDDPECRAGCTRRRDCERTRLGDPRWTITEYSGQLGPGFILRRKEAISVAVNGGKWLGALYCRVQGLTKRQAIQHLHHCTVRFRQGNTEGAR